MTLQLVSTTVPSPRFAKLQVCTGTTHTTTLSTLQHSLLSPQATLYLHWLRCSKSSVGRLPTARCHL